MLLAKEPLLLNAAWHSCLQEGNFLLGWQVSNKSSSVSVALGGTPKILLHTCAQARTPRLALPKALLEPWPSQHLFHITLLIFQALWTHSIPSQMFPSSTSPHGMNTPNSAEERVQMFGVCGRLWYGVCAQPNAQTTCRD